VISFPHTKRELPI